jgi:hypothetical protein
MDARIIAIPAGAVPVAIFDPKGDFGMNGLVGLNDPKVKFSLLQGFFENAALHPALRDGPGPHSREAGTLNRFKKLFEFGFGGAGVRGRLGRGHSE